VSEEINISREFSKYDSNAVSERLNRNVDIKSALIRLASLQLAYVKKTERSGCLQLKSASPVLVK